MGESDESQALKRSGFFSGRLLTPEDFEREQQYVREKFKRHNRTLHGFGIVSGLKVTMKAGQIIVEAGLALDCAGNEILIGTPQSIAPPPPVPIASSPAVSSPDASSPDVLCTDNPASSSAVAGQSAFLNVRFAEDSTAESFAFEVGRENCNRGHRHVRARWLACGQPHALTIAKLRHRSHGWTVDRGYRPPAVK